MKNIIVQPNTVTVPCVIMSCKKEANTKWEKEEHEVYDHFRQHGGESRVKSALLSWCVFRKISSKMFYDTRTSWMLKDWESKKNNPPNLQNSTPPPRQRRESSRNKDHFHFVKPMIENFLVFGNQYKATTLCVGGVA